MSKTGTKKRGRKALKIIIIVLAAFMAANMAFAVVFFHVFFHRYETETQSLEISYDEIDSSAYPRREVQFTSGRNTLTGYVYNEHEDSQGLVLIAHGMGGGADSMLPQIMWLSDNGWTVFAFDGTGTRSSEGASIRGLAMTKYDVIAAVEYIESDDTLASLPLCLLGHSMGAYGVSAAADDFDDICAVAEMCGFDRPMTEMYYTAEGYIGPAAIVGYPFLWLENEFIFGAEGNESASKALDESDVPCLIAYAADDDRVPPEDAGIIANADEITDQETEIIEVSEGSRDGHSEIWLTDSAAQYKLECEAALDALEDEYDGDVPQSVLDEFYAGIDKTAMYELDEDFMNEINAFFLEAVGVK